MLQVVRTTDVVVCSYEVWVGSVSGLCQCLRIMCILSVEGDVAVAPCGLMVLLTILRRRLLSLYVSVLTWFHLRCSAQGEIERSVSSVFVTCITTC